MNLYASKYDESLNQLPASFTSAVWALFKVGSGEAWCCSLCTYDFWHLLWVTDTQCCLLTLTHWNKLWEYCDINLESAVRSDIGMFERWTNGLYTRDMEVVMRWYKRGVVWLWSYCVACVNIMRRLREKEICYTILYYTILYCTIIVCITMYLCMQFTDMIMTLFCYCLKLCH
jgi:hypothetical protein